ncbi:alpha/beta hydrolase fold domain-containing protein [Nonomuraea sp. NPDC048916]|uniref:alpha/beta hydrolase fold domain-containing protein n=1 Tax=Nonomuraea sp. NPDC048916 TaxID=3154232 RepID=UPI003411412C
MRDALVVIGPGLIADPALLGETAEREFAALGVPGTIVHARDAAEVLSCTERAGGSGTAVVAVPGPSAQVRALMGRVAGPVVWLDLARVDDAEVGEGATHLHGRGIAGLAWAIRHAVHRLSHPRRRIPYGDHRDQWADLYLPARPAGPAAQTPSPGSARSADSVRSEGSARSADSVRSEGSARSADSVRSGGSARSADSARSAKSAESPGRPGSEGAAGVAQSVSSSGPAGVAGPVGAPVAVLVHGGNWRSVWAADLMDALALDLVDRGFAVWNLEYRRPDPHGWQATTDDVAAGLEALAGVDAPVDLDRVAVVGHSAGAQLALRAAADGARVSLAVSLAGMLDLVEADRRWLGSGAVAAALGTHPDAGARLYGAASPLLRLPLKVRQLVVQGSGDELDLVDFARRYARAAGEAGDDVTYLEMSGDHFAVIDPRAPIWRTTALAITETLH